MSDYSKLPPIACSLGGFAFNGEHIEYWKARALKAEKGYWQFAEDTKRDEASLRAQLAEANQKLEWQVQKINELDNMRQEDERKIASARKALERLACRHVKGTPLWWQREAREAVSSLSDEQSEPSGSHKQFSCLCGIGPEPCPGPDGKALCALKTEQGEP